MHQFALKWAEYGSPPSPPSLSSSLQLSINRLQFLFGLIVMDADVWKPVLEITNQNWFQGEGARWGQGVQVNTEGLLVAPTWAFKGVSAFISSRHPLLDQSDPLHKHALGWRGEGMGGRRGGKWGPWGSSLSAYFHCQGVAKATVFDAYNNARTPPCPPPSSSPVPYIHIIYSVCGIGRSHWEWQ